MNFDAQLTKVLLLVTVTADKISSFERIKKKRQYDKMT